MYNISRLYELSFASAGRRLHTNPRIVFTVRSAHLEEIGRRLRIIAADWKKRAAEYCPAGATFAHPAPDLFGRIEFGYGRCGSVTSEDEETHLNIELSGGEQLYCSTLTMKVLTEALLVPIESGDAPNQIQQVDLQMRCDMHDPIGYNHAVSGYVSSQVLNWLRVHGKRARDGGDIPIHAEVAAAMREVWIAVCIPDHRQWASECRGRISSDGRFMLKCFGDACDLAIYPDGTCGHMADAYAQFSCHNLDTAVQQATLIAGLAKLCELARREE